MINRLATGAILTVALCACKADRGADGSAAPAPLPQVPTSQSNSSASLPPPVTPAVSPDQASETGDDATPPAIAPEPATEVGDLGFEFGGKVPADLAQLSIAGAVSVVAAQDRAGVASAGALEIDLGLADGAATEYDRDATNVSVKDHSMQMLAFANGMLCIFAQTSYLDFVDAGPYEAMVDADSCFKRANSQDGSISEAPRTVTSMTLDVSRGGLEKPILVKAWFDVTVEDTALRLQIQLTVAKGADVRNPFGVFRLRYRGTDPQGPPDAAPRLKGAVEIVEDAQRNVFVSQIDSSSGGAGLPALGTTRSSAKLVYDASGKNVSGVARKLHDGARGPSTPLDSPSGSETESLVAYDAARYFSDENGQSCRDRDDPITRVYRYGVYDKISKKRVFSPRSAALISKPQPGVGGAIFGIVSGSNPSIRIWPDPVDGEELTVYDQDQTGLLIGTSKARVARTRGRLISRTNVPKPVTVLHHGVYVTNQYYAEGATRAQVSWNPGLIRFEVLAETDVNGDSFSPVEPPVRFGTAGNGNGILVGVSDGGIAETINLRGTFIDREQDQTLTDVRLEMQYLVSGSVDEDIYFRCVVGCLAPNFSAEDADHIGSQGNGNIYLSNPVSADDAPRYVFEVATQTLMYLDPNQTPTATIPGDNGAKRRSVEMPGTDILPLDDDPINGANGPRARIAAMSMVRESDFSTTDPNWGSVNESAPESFLWSTSNRDPDHYQYVRSDVTNAALKIVTNPTIEYVLAAEDMLTPPEPPRTVGNFEVFGIDEFGFLKGLPVVYDSNWESRPAFALKPGTIAGSYIVKPLDIEERMPELDPEACLTLATPADLPEPPPYQLFADPAIGDKPAIAGGPSVITGRIIR